MGANIAALIVAMIALGIWALIQRARHEHKRITAQEWLERMRELGIGTGPFSPQSCLGDSSYFKQKD